jgi:hypothetical protein
MRPTVFHTTALHRLLLSGLGTLALIVSAIVARPAQGATAASVAGETAASTPTTTVGGPAPAGTQGQAGTPPASGTATAPAATPTATSAPEVQAQVPQAKSPPTAAPEVQAKTPQMQSTPGAPRGAIGHGRAHGRKAGPASGLGTGEAPAKRLSTRKAPLPSALTPPLPSSLGAPIAGIPDFFIESFRVPPFLLPIYQAAGTAYGISWQVLAAINEVETDYGRDLNVSSAGAEGWMQFLPSSWAIYGVDANGDGYMDPYNPADAVFAAARYLAAAGGARNIRAAIYSYNHSQSYVDSVMLRAQLLGGTPPELLAAITGLTEARFPVHAAAHFTDGFQTVPGTGVNDPSRTLPGTTIYAPAGAPVIAVQDGQIVAIGDSPTLGRYVSLRDAYGNTYTYAQLGSLAELYPVLEPREHTAVSPRIANPGAGPRPSAAASAGVQPHSPLTEGAVDAGLALGAAASLEAAPPAPATPAPAPALPVSPAPASPPRAFRAGPDEVYLHALRPGVEVLAGTVLGHLGAGGEAEGVGDPTATQPAAGANAGAPLAGASISPAAGQPEAHMLFQIRPAGAGAPLIDPKPILDGWVRLEDTSIFRAKGENPFLATSPTVGQVLLESKPQLEQQVLRDPGVRFATRCGRGDVRAGQVDRRVLATLEFLSVSGLKPTVSALRCGHDAGAAGAGIGAGNHAVDAVDISAIDGTPIAGHEGVGSIADIAVHRLLRLQGTMKPRQIVSSLSYPGSDNTLTLPGYRGLIRVSFEVAGGARAASAREASALTPSQWLELTARLGEIPDPTVVAKPSAAAIPDASVGVGGR